MIQGAIAIYKREMLILKRRFIRHAAGQAISPLLYLVTFGYAMGSQIKFNGISYLEFLVPGLVAMSSMTQAFSIATDINIARFYWRIFDEFLSAPISNMAYVTGEVLAGMTRAILGIFIILTLGLAFGVNPFGPWEFWAGILLNSFLFASLAVALAMIVKNHADQALLNSFVITPMAFLSGTFFPVEKLPGWIHYILYLVPLTHAAKVIRASLLGRPVNHLSLLYLLLAGTVCFWLALSSVEKARD